MCYRDDKPFSADDWRQAAKDIFLMCVLFLAVVLVAAINDPGLGR